MVPNKTAFVEVFRDVSWGWSYSWRC